MLERRWSRYVSGMGLVLAVAGLGFTADTDPPFVRAGVLVGAIGLACFLLIGWLDFGGKSQW
jgi:hypothetical protein